MAADYRHIGGVENRLGRHYSRFSPFSPTPALAGQSLALRKLWNAGSNRRSRAKTVWEGAVHVFDLSGHPTATRAYAWSSPIEGSTKRRFFAVLHQPPVDTPHTAVRAAIVAEGRSNLS